MKKILVVDDEEALVSFMSELLDIKGYSVIGTSDPIEALEWFTQQHENITVVVTDLTMPGKTGLELSKEMNEIDPNIPIFLLTGYLDQLHSGELKTEYISEYLEKPIDISHFLKKISQYAG